MQVYKNRPVMPSDRLLWHYTTRNAVVAMVNEGQMRLTRIDAFKDKDPFEGSVPRQSIEDQGVILRGSEMMQTMMVSVTAHYPGNYNIPKTQYRDRWSEMTQRRRAMTRSAHAICWRAGDESEAMWKLYCEDGTRGQGLAIRTTLGKLEQSVSQHDVIVSPVTYRHYHTGPAFTDDLDAFMHKRNGFRHESELRLLAYNKDHYLAHASFIGGHAELEPDPLPTHTYLEWSLCDTVDSVVVSPYSTPEYEGETRSAIGVLSASLAQRVELSELSERRYEAHF